MWLKTGRSKMMARRILKRYLDEEEWNEVSQEQAIAWLESFYIDVQPVLEELCNGHTVFTDVAEYRQEAPTPERFSGPPPGGSPAPADSERSL
jgi:hypothetical protein